uniref:MADS-box domain-containing protein n=1 Tax=Strongyloides papillosus TaxID=174720 RepID=A0A0N5BBB2_STREA
MAGILPEGGRQVIEKTECFRNSKSNLQLITLKAQGLKNKLLELTKASLDFNSHAILMLIETTVDIHYGDNSVMIPIIYKNNLSSYQHMESSRITENWSESKKI